MGFKLGDKVRKVGGDYTFEGTIVAGFKKLSGLERFVVEDDRGVLHVYSEKNLVLRPPPPPPVRVEDIEFGNYCVLCIQGQTGDHGHPKCEKRQPRLTYCKKCDKINGGTDFKEITDDALSKLFKVQVCECDKNDKL